MEDYQCGVRGHGYIAIARKHGLPVGTVRDVIVRGEWAEGDLVAPRGHKKKLNSGNQTKLWRALDQNPFATNRELRGVGE